jgi:hypothetical protein
MTICIRHCRPNNDELTQNTHGEQADLGEPARLDGQDGDASCVISHPFRAQSWRPIGGQACRPPAADGTCTVVLVDDLVTVLDPTCAPRNVKPHN